MSFAELGSVLSSSRSFLRGVMEGEAWGRACAGVTFFWGGISIREVKSGTFFRTLHRVCSKSGVTDHTVDTQENTECQRRKGTYSVHSKPPRCTHRDTEASGRGQLVMVTQLGSHSPGSSEPPAPHCRPVIHAVSSGQAPRG